MWAAAGAITGRSPAVQISSQSHTHINSESPKRVSGSKCFESSVENKALEIKHRKFYLSLDLGDSWLVELLQM